ncbi:heme-degrading domain-containing protein [Celerinatantimonas sp. YJH-8]|uniref:heme-degrading domain-containing protein n=1 Tax=Celerinatantimonas sp. YJH-8 TaxID=3228714 RepID=UPI0038C1296A
MSTALMNSLLEQEQQLQFKRFNLDIAWQLGQRLRETAQSRQSPVAIEIYAFEQVVFKSVCAGARPDQSQWITMKRQSVIRYGHSTLYLGEYNKAKGRVFETQPHIDASQYCAHGGSFPITIQDCGIVGAITVAGMSSEDDHQLIVDELTTLLAEL